MVAQTEGETIPITAIEFAAVTALRSQGCASCQHSRPQQPLVHERLACFDRSARACCGCVLSVVSVSPDLLQSGKAHGSTRQGRLAEQRQGGREVVLGIAAQYMHLSRQIRATPSALVGGPMAAARRPMVDDLRPL